MVTIKEAYGQAKKISVKDNLRQILSFEKGYGFIFSTDRNSIDLSNVCIFIGKSDPTESAIIPIVFENIDFIQSGQNIALTTVL